MIRLSYSVAAIFISFVILCSCIYNIRWKEDKWKGTVVSDACGYYAYLPAIFIYHDLQYDAIYRHEKEVFGNTAGYYIGSIDGKNVNRYFAGEAVLLSPFFLTAHLLTKVTGGQADGYSQLYQESISIAALFYLFVGLWFLRKLMQLYEIEETIMAATLLLFVFGTNLFHYVVSEPGMSHVYSFALITVFIYCIKRAQSDVDAKNILRAAITLALICLVRPPNVLIVGVIPFIAGSPDQLKKLRSQLFSSAKTILLAAVAFFLIVSIQPVLYLLQAGKPFVYSYQNQTFDFTRPEIVNVLFSYRKGLFIYTPLLLISMFFFIPLWRSSRYRFFSLFIFLFIITYVISCWFMWYYGASFGMRAMIDFYPVFALIFALLLNQIRNPWMKYALFTLGAFFIYVNQVQAYQFRNYIMEWDRMSKFKYWKVFLKTDEKYSGLFWHNTFYDDVEGKTVRHESINFDDPAPAWGSLNGIQLPVGDNNSKSQQLDDKNIYGATLTTQNQDYLYRNPRLVVKIKFKACFKDTATKACVVLSIDSTSKTYFYKAEEISKIINLQANQWQEGRIAFKLPYSANKEDILKAYILFEKGQPINIDDLDVEIVDAEIW